MSIAVYRNVHCQECGAVHDRDVNSARNILRLGQQALVEGAATERSCHVWTMVRGIRLAAGAGQVKTGVVPTMAGPELDREWAEDLLEDVLEEMASGRCRDMERRAATRDKLRELLWRPGIGHRVLWRP